MLYLHNKIIVMTLKVIKKIRSKKEKNELRLKIFILGVSFYITKIIISDWEHFKDGLFGSF